MHVIRYRRPETPWSLSRVTVEGGAAKAAAQVERLVRLGYAVAEVTPPLETAPQTDDESDPRWTPTPADPS